MARYLRRPNMTLFVRNITDESSRSYSRHRRSRSLENKYRGPPHDHHRAHHEAGSRSHSASHSPSLSRSRPKGKKSQSRSHSPPEDFHPAPSSHKQLIGRSPSRSYSRSVSRGHSRSSSWAGRKSGGH